MNCNRSPVPHAPGWHRSTTTRSSLWRAITPISACQTDRAQMGCGWTFTTFLPTHHRIIAFFLINNRGIWKKKGAVHNCGRPLIIRSFLLHLLADYSLAFFNASLSSTSQAHAEVQLLHALYLHCLHVRKLGQGVFPPVL